MHDALRIEVMRFQVHAQLGVSVPDGDQFQARPSVKGRAADALLEALELAFVQSRPDVLVHRG